MIGIKSIVRLGSVFFVMLFVTACVCKKASVLPEDFLQQQGSTVLVADNELIVLLAEGADIAKLKMAWEIFGFTYSFIGPEKNRLLLVTVPAEFELDKVKANISETKGVSEVQVNDIKKPFGENKSLE